MGDEPKDDGDDLWQHVTKDVRPIVREGLVRPKSPAAPRAGRVTRIPDLALPDRRDREAPKTGRAAPDKSSTQVDRQTERRLKRGKIEVEARLDLHGYTLEQAHRALREFVGQASARGLRCVLVVTGKGEIGAGDGVTRPRGGIKRELPHWLAQDPLHSLVLKATPAQIGHGGSGAFYLYLRRARG